MHNRRLHQISINNLSFFIVHIILNKDNYTHEQIKYQCAELGPHISILSSLFHGSLNGYLAGSSLLPSTSTIKFY